MEGGDSLSDVGDRAQVIVMGAVGEVESGDVHTGQNHLLQSGYTATGRPWKT